MKKCGKCGVEKEIEFFSLNKNNKDGHASICKKCHSDYRKENYKKNKIKVILQVNEYRINNPEKYTSKKTNCYHKKQGRVIEHKCSFCGGLVYATKKNIEKNNNLYCSKNCKDKNNKSDYYNYLQDVKKRAIKTNKEFDIDENFIKNLLENEQNGRCNITHIPIKIKNKHSLSDIIKTASLDRIDNSKGYTKDNLQWVCLGINYMKSKSTDDKLHEFIKLIIDNYNSM